MFVRAFIKFDCVRKKREFSSAILSILLFRNGGNFYRNLVLLIGFISWFSVVYNFFQDY